MRARFFFLALTFLYLGGTPFSWAQGRPLPSVQDSRSPQRASLPFSHDLKGTLAAAKASGKPVVLAFVAAWCPVCGQMRRGTFRSPTVLALAGEFLWVMVDIDRKLSTARQYGVEGVPHIYLLDSEGRIRKKLLGLQEAAEFHGNLRRFQRDLTQPQNIEPAETEIPEAGYPHSSVTWKPKGYRSRSICFSHVGYGPLHLYSQSPFQSLRLGILPRTPSTLGKGQYELRGSSAWANVWATGEDYFLDLEILQNSLTLSYGITDTLEIEGEFQNRSRFGGQLDGFTQGFHDLFGIAQNGRDQVPKGEFVFRLNPPGKRPAVSLETRDKGTFSRTLQVSLQHNVTCGTASLPAFSYSVTARVETEGSGEIRGGRDVDLGASVAASRRLGKSYLYLTVGYAWFGRDDFRGIELEDTQLTALAAFEWRFLPRQSLLLQYLFTEGLIEDFEPFSEASNEITLGWKWEAIPRGTLEVGLIENVVSFDNGPDFGIHTGFSYRF